VTDANEPTDPVLIKRARIARLAALGQRIGYSLFGIAIVLFIVGYVTEYSSLLVTLIVVCLVAGSAVLAPAIVAGYGVKAAEREGL
jgi:hypothetical protein